MMLSGKPPPSSLDDVQEERRRLRYLRTLVDLTASVIMQTRMERTEAERVVEATRSQILTLFPGKEKTYNLIYRPRFDRLIREFASHKCQST